MIRTQLHSNRATRRQFKALARSHLGNATERAVEALEEFSSIRRLPISRKTQMLLLPQAKQIILKVGSKNLTQAEATTFAEADAIAAFLRFGVSPPRIPNLTSYQVERSSICHKALSSSGLCIQPSQMSSRRTRTHRASASKIFLFTKRKTGPRSEETLTN